MEAGQTDVFDAVATEEHVDLAGISSTSRST
jgi:hypothetical protein